MSRNFGQVPLCEAGWPDTAAEVGLPPGVYFPYGGSSAPTGYLLCNGAAVSRTTYAALFAVISTAFGAGNGTTTFNVPNLAGRIPVGLDSGDADFDTIGKTGGAKTVAAAGTNSAPMFTGSALGTHSHGTGTYATASASAGTPSGTVSQPTFTGSALGTHSHSFTQTGNDASPDLLQADLTGTGVAAKGGTSADSAGTPAGTVSQPTFSGDALSGHAHNLSGSSAAVSAGTPAGTVSAPTFTGSATSVLQLYVVSHYIIKT